MRATFEGKSITFLDVFIFKVVCNNFPQVGTKCIKNTWWILAPNPSVERIRMLNAP